MDELAKLIANRQGANKMDFSQSLMPEVIPQYRMNKAFTDVQGATPPMSIQQQWQLQTMLQALGLGMAQK